MTVPQGGETVVSRNLKPNVLIREDVDSLLFNELSKISPRARSARIRSLAMIGLMVINGDMKGIQQVADKEVKNIPDSTKELQGIAKNMLKHSHSSD